MSINRINASVPEISNVVVPNASSSNGALAGLKAAGVPVRGRASDVIAKGPGFDSGRRDIASGVRSKECGAPAGNEYRPIPASGVRFKECDAPAGNEYRPIPAEMKQEG